MYTSFEVFFQPLLFYWLQIPLREWVNSQHKFTFGNKTPSLHDLQKLKQNKLQFFLKDLLIT
jgi:hypothetical protein